jgi:hypothetical protein
MSDDRGRTSGGSVAPQVIVALSVAALIAIPIMRWLAVGAAMAVPSVGTARSTTSNLTAPASLAGRCRDQPLAHVHDPSRFDLVDPCFTVTGTVVRSDLVEAFGDFKMWVLPDPKSGLELPAANHGVVVAAIIPPDRPFFNAPKAGVHAALTGAWVRDVDGGALELHPVWRIDVRGTSTIADPAHDLNVDVSMPSEVVVGHRIDPMVRISSDLSRVSHLRRQVHLFLEVRSTGGGGVAWKGAQTSTLGFTGVDLVALVNPGAYEVTVYAWKAHHYGLITLPLTVRRR